MYEENERYLKSEMVGNLLFIRRGIANDKISELSKDGITVGIFTTSDDKVFTCSLVIKR